MRTINNQYADIKLYMTQQFLMKLFAADFTNKQEVKGQNCCQNEYSNVTEESMSSQHGNNKIKHPEELRAVLMVHH